MADRAPFLQVPLDLFSDPALNDGDLRVYCTVLSFADFGTLADCRPGLAAIAVRAGKDKSTVARSLARLESSGWLARERRTVHGKECDTTLYSFPRHSHGLLHQRDNLVAPARQPSCTSATGVVAPVRQGVVAPVRQNLEPCTKSHDLEDPPAPSVHAPKGADLQLEAPTQAPKKRKATPPFRPPDLAEVRAYFAERGGQRSEAEVFVDFYASKGWLVGKSKMKDWRASVRNWMRRDSGSGGNGGRPSPATTHNAGLYRDV